MIYLAPLPAHPATLRAQIEALELQREALRQQGRLSPTKAQSIARDLSELRQAHAVAIAKEAA